MSSDAARRLFISYGHPEEKICRRIYDFLTAHGFEVWFDKKDIHRGANWREEIARGIRASNGGVLAMLSRHSVRNPGVCLDELSIAIGVKGGNILTILLEPEREVNPPPSLTNNQWLDMSRWREMEKQGEEIFSRWLVPRLQELLDILESPASKNFAGDIEFIRSKLPKAVVSRSKQAALLAKPFVGREWLAKQVNAYLDREDGSNICLLYGDPGIGKSAFAAHYTHYNGRVAAAIFCEYNHRHFNEPKTIIQTLAFLLACRLPDYRYALKDFLENNKSWNYEEGEMFDLLLTNPLLTESIDGHRETLAIIIDGLDECGDAEQNAFAEVLLKYAERLPRWLKILALSRRVQGVQAPAADAESIELRSDDENNKADVRKYFKMKLDKQLAQTDDAERILDALSERSGGICLYAEMIADGILKGKLDIHCEDQYPRGLSEAFTRWFGWFFPDRKEYNEEFFMPLSMLLASPEPLPEEELKRVMGWRDRQLHRFVARVDVLLQHGTNDFGKATLALSHRYISEWLSSRDAGIYRAEAEDAAAEMVQCFYACLQEDAEELTAYEAMYLTELLEMAGMQKELKEAQKDRGLLAKLHDYGKWCFEWGKHERALELYQKALQITRNAVRERGTLDKLRDLSVSCDNVADVLYAQGDMDGAMKLYLESMEIDRKLAKERGLPDDQRDLSVSCGKVADVLYAQGDTDGALKLYREGMEIDRRLAKERGLPDDRRDLSVSYNNVANVLKAQGDADGALELYRESMEIRRKLAAERGLPEDRRDLSFSCNKVADVLKTQGDADGALELYRESMEINRKLAEERGQLEDRRDLSVSCNRVADVLYAQGDTDGALKLYREGMEISRKLASERGLPEDLRDLWVSCNKVADVLYAQGDMGGALKLYREGMEISRKLVAERGLPQDMHDLFISCYKMAEILKALGRREEAASFKRESIEIAQVLSKDERFPAEMRMQLLIYLLMNM